MKKFPEVFVPIDAVFEILLNRHMSSFKAKEARSLMALKTNIRCMMNRLPYAESLLNKCHEGTPERLTELKAELAKWVADNEKLIPESEWEHLKVVGKNKRGLPGVNDLNAALEKLSLSITIKKNFTDYRRGHTRITQLFGSINKLLAENGYCEISLTRSVTQAQKRKNRYRVDCHNLVKHLMATYTPVAQNPVEDKESFFAAISKRILGA